MDLPSTPWTIHLSQIYSLYSSSPDGLDPKTVFQNRGLFGSNHLLLQKPRTALSILVAQFENWLVIILIIAALFSYFLGEKVDSLFILGIIGMSVVLGFFQEYRAENSLDKLKNLLTHKARVKRQGVWTEINSDDLVVGDIIELRIGDRVPADIRLLETDNFAIDQSLLTGESVPVVKTEHPLSDSQLSLTEQSNLAFSSTYVTSGLATGLVISTGKNTYVGKTAIRLEQKENHTDFQTQIQKFSAFLFRTVIVLTAFVFLSNSLLGKGVFDSFFFALALAVGIAPELLPMIITVTLSQSALKMAKKQVVIKRLISVEDFGNMDTLCTDKTGTLTQGTFSLDSYVDLHNNVDDTTLIYGLVCSSGFKNSGHTTSSNQIDQALWDSPLKSSVTPHLIQYTLLDENEFDFDRKRMSVVAKQADHKLLIAKGSSESIITACSHYWNGKATQKITQTIKKTLLQKAIDLENQGYKTISVAYKKTLHSETSLSDETQLTFRGFLLFSDPIKESAVHSLHLFQKLGVNIKVLSGDSPQVVKHIGLQTQLAQPSTNVVTGDQLIGLTSSQLEDIIKNNSLFAKITPDQKYLIVNTLNQEGHVVGFLGDGINDAPALKAADVGITVDSAADVAKEASDIVLLQKDLSVLAQGIEMGRKTFGNITKYILNTISANYGNMTTVAISSLFLPFIPLLPIQILLNNLISDVPLLAISTDHVDSSYVKRPRKWNLRLIMHFMIYFGFISSLFDFATILPLLFIWKASPEVFRTAWFIESSLSEMLITFAIRTRLPFYRSQPSRWLILLSVLSALLVIALPHFLPYSSMFGFSPLPLSIAVWTGLVLIAYFVTTEIFKGLFYKRFSD